MHDPKYLRDNLDLVRTSLGRRGQDVPWDAIQKLSDERRSLTTQVEQLRHELKKGSDDVAQRRRNKIPADEAIQAMKQVGDRIKDLETGLRDTEDTLNNFALRIPNLPHHTVPQGTDSTHNIEVRRWGTIPSFSSPPKPHWEIGEALGILDFDRAAKIAGARFAVLSGAGAKMERALIDYMLDLHTDQHGYREILSPALVNRQTMTGTGQLPKFEDDLFRLRDEDWFLIPTAEVPVTNLHRDEILAEDRLAIRYTA